MKKIAIGLLVALLLAVTAVGFQLYRIFGNNKSVVDGAVHGRATTVVDVPYVAMFLVDIGGGKYVLVDAGAKPERETVEAALTAKGATLADLEAVLLTHGHGDHIGAAYALLDVPLWVHEAEVALTEGTVPPKNDLGKLTGANPPGLKVDHTFKGGDKLRFGDVEIEVFHAPGHTPGNCAFLVDGVLLLGDTAQVTSAERLQSAPEIFSEDPAQAIASIRALGQEIGRRETKPTVLAPAHSGATENVAALLEYQGDE